MFYIYFTTTFVSTGKAYTVYTEHTILELPGLWLGYVFTFFFQRGGLDFDLFDFQIIICSCGFIILDGKAGIRHNFIERD